MRNLHTFIRKLTISFFFAASCFSVFAGNGKIACLDLRGLLKIDLSDSIAVLSMWDGLHAVSTLQGIVNRRAPRLFVNYIVNGTTDVDSYWWAKYRTEGQWLAGKDTIALTGIGQAVEFFRNDIKGVVAYDSNVASTSCVASAVAGAEGLIALRYDDSPRSLYYKLVMSGPKLPVKVWLVNRDGSPMFTGRGMVPETQCQSTGSAKCDPYIWLIEKYIKTGRCNTQYAGYYIDQKWRDMPQNGPMNHHTLTNHDFFVSRGGFFFDLSPWDDEPATDEPSQKAGTDCKTLTLLLREAYNRNKGRKMCYIGGFPEWAYKYTKHAGGKHGDVETEWHFSELISRWNAFKDADAIGYGALANASFWQHFPMRSRYAQRATADKAEMKKIEKGKNYIIFYVGDYDASSWVSQRVPDLWDARERGDIPLMWCISPVLCERIPHVLNYIRLSATKNDYFAAADNGAGYFMPGVAEREDSLNHAENRIRAWEKHCRKYYRRFGLSVTGFIIDGYGPAMGKSSLDAYEKFSPDGIVPQKCPDASLHGKMPVLRSDADLVSDDPKEAAKVLVARVHDRGIPFHWFRAILKSPRWYEQVYREAKRMDNSIELLNGPEFFGKLRFWLRQRAKRR